MSALRSYIHRLIHGYTEQDRAAVVFETAARINVHRDVVALRIGRPAANQP